MRSMGVVIRLETNQLTPEASSATSRTPMPMRKRMDPMRSSTAVTGMDVRRTPDQRLIHNQGQGHVHHVLLQGVAVADAHPHLAQVGIPNLLTVKMTGHIGRHLFGIGNHPAIGKNHGHPGDRLTGGILAEAVQGLLIQRGKQADGLLFQQPAVDLQIHLGALEVELAGKAQCIPAHRKQRNQGDIDGNNWVISFFLFFI
jgi:hypothetical protein